jgi:PEP-CTERM motif
MRTQAARQSRTVRGGALSSATATGGDGGANLFYPAGAGGDATAVSTATANRSGGASSSATATGGQGGPGVDAGTIGGAGGNANASSAAKSNGSGGALSSATATGGQGGPGLGFPAGGGDATAIADAHATGAGMATATAIATGGIGGSGFGSGAPGANGAADATSSATTDHGATAQAQSTAVGSSGQAQSTAQTNLGRAKSVATAPVGSTATTNAIAQAGGSGQVFANPGQTAYAFSVGAPDKAYSTTLIGGASNVAGTLLGPRDAIFGAAILGGNYAPDGGGESHTYNATATFDFDYHGDLLLGLIDNQASGFDNNGLGFKSMEFYVLNVSDGSTVLDVTLGNLSVAESFFRDLVLNLGSYSGPAVDLTFGYNLTANGSGGFGVDFAVGGAVPEPSTWAMMLLGFAGLGYAGYRRARTA